MRVVVIYFVSAVLAASCAYAISKDSWLLFLAFYAAGGVVGLAGAHK